MLAAQMLGHRLTTKQTPPGGVLVRKVMVAEALPIDREFYLAIVMDRASGGPVIVASPDGGVDIEQVAASTPERIYRVPVADAELDKGPSVDALLALADRLGMGGQQAIKEDFVEQVRALYRLFMHVDATQVEINPLGLSGQQRTFVQLRLYCLKKLMGESYYKWWRSTPRSISTTTPRIANQRFSPNATSARRTRAKSPPPKRT